MKFLLALIPLSVMLTPSAALALQLRWGNGADTLSFVSDTRCILILRADSTEALPQEWRLAWQADSSGVNFVAVDSLDACEADTAKVSNLDAPATLADSLAHLLTAYFCSEDGPAKIVAYYVMDQVGGSQGRLKVVALDPTDPNLDTVIESNEVTYNGGGEGAYAPVLLRAESVHETAELRVKVVGSGLDSVQTMKIGAADDLWSVSLAIDERDSTSIEATANVYAPLPEAVVQVATSWGASDAAWLAGEEFSTASAASAGVDTILYRDPNPSVYPKDFAFYYNSVYNATNPAHPWKGYFHLFYIRNKKTLASPDSIIGHAWTDSLGKPWSVDTLAFRPSGVGWDKKKVWAPSLQQVGNLTYMFYTGVDSLNNQSIGFATTEMLGTTNISWTRRATPAYRAADAPSWADSIGSHQPGIIQFRDPFVMPDPDVANYPGRYLLFNAGEQRSIPGRYTIGVARNNIGTLNTWRDLRNYEATDYNHLPVAGALESPLVVRDSLTGAWRIFVANAQYDDNGYFSTIFLTQTVGDSLTDIRASRWPQRDSLYHYVGDDADMIGWQACEHLQIGQVHFFAAYEGNGIGITRMHWNPTTQRFIFVHPDVTDVRPHMDQGSVRFFISELRSGGGFVRFALESAGTIVPRLVVYDITGRRVRRLADGRAMQGQSEVRWDCRDDAGNPVSSGLYFARMSEAGTAQVVRVPILR